MKEVALEDALMVQQDFSRQECNEEHSRQRMTSDEVLELESSQMTWVVELIFRPPLIFCFEKFQTCPK